MSLFSDLLPPEFVALTYEIYQALYKDVPCRRTYPPDEKHVLLERVYIRLRERLLLKQSADYDQNISDQPRRQKTDVEHKLETDLKSLSTQVFRDLYIVATSPDLDPDRAARATLALYYRFAQAPQMPMCDRLSIDGSEIEDVLWTIVDANGASLSMRALQQSGIHHEFQYARDQLSSLRIEAHCEHGRVSCPECYARTVALLKESNLQSP